MSVLPACVEEIKLQRMYSVKQIFADEFLEDVAASTRHSLAANKGAKKIRKGESVAVLVGSRGITALDTVTREVITFLQNSGAEPFIVPAMGSHGGGIAEEQRKIIEDYGITESAMGVPIKSSMDTVVIGEYEGIPIHIDLAASEADHIVPIVRIKAHTDFDGPIESGFCKMLAIGLAKHNGCSRMHTEGFARFPVLIPAIGAAVLEKRTLPFGVAIIENAHEHVHSVHAVSGEDILEKEPELLALSKSLMPRLNFEHIDVLVVEKMGKNITGAGMDPNITGRSSRGVSPFFTGPTITNLIVLSLTKESHHNANGVGYADFITQELFDDIDLATTYTNGIAAGAVGPCKIPVILKDEREALLAAIHTCPRIDCNRAKIVKIQDTLHLTEIEVSESLLEYCRASDLFVVPDRFDR